MTKKQLLEAVKAKLGGFPRYASDIYDRYDFKKEDNIYKLIMTD